MSPALFFRAFDLAFFVPGSMVLMHLLYTFRSKVPWDKLEAAGDKTAVGIIYIAGIVVVSFVIGLLCHCMARLIILKFKDDVKHFGHDNSQLTVNPKPYSGGDKSWIDYFWYLRATCWNTSMALVFIGFLELVHSAFQCTLCSGYSIGFTVLYLVAALAMWFLGCDYHRAYTTRVESQRNTAQAFTYTIIP
jgi:hypothetical protein